MEPGSVERLLKGRRSIRRYSAEPVPREKLERLIDVARYAPTGQNAQSVSWLVLYESAKVRELAGAIVQWMHTVIEHQPAMARSLHMPWFVDCWSRGIDTVLRGAPHLVIVHGPENGEIARMGCLMTLSTFEAVLALAPAFAGTHRGIRPRRGRHPVYRVGWQIRDDDAAGWVERVAGLYGRHGEAGAGGVRR